MGRVWRLRPEHGAHLTGRRWFIGSRHDVTYEPGGAGKLSMPAGREQPIRGELRDGGFVHNRMYGWGSNSNGQLNVPVDLTNVVFAAAGWYNSFAIRADGTALGWGWNSQGQATVPL